MEERDIRIFPNPTSYDIDIELHLPKAQEVSFEVYSINGIQTHFIPGSTLFGEVKQKIDFSALASGVYRVRAKIGQQFVTGKVIKHE